MNDLVIRTADMADAAALSRLGAQTFFDTFRALFADQDEFQAHIDSVFSLATTSELLARPDNIFVLAEADGRAAGYARTVLHGAEAKLERMYVDVRWIGRDAAAPLLAAAEHRARERGAESMTLSVLRENERAQRFYRKHGFEAYSTESYAIGSQSFHFLLMRKPNIA